MLTSMDHTAQVDRENQNVTDWFVIMAQSKMTIVNLSDYQKQGDKVIRYFAQYCDCSPTETTTQSLLRGRALK